MVMIIMAMIIMAMIIMAVITAVGTRIFYFLFCNAPNYRVPSPPARKTTACLVPQYRGYT
jgi:hypothetical protein